MIREGVKRLLVPAMRTNVQKRSQSVVTGPPTQYVSNSEKYITFFAMFFGHLAIPAWILHNLPAYRGK